MCIRLLSSVAIFVCIHLIRRFLKINIMTLTMQVQKGQAMARIVCPRYTPSRKKVTIEKGKAHSKHEKEHDDKEKDTKHSQESGKSKKLSNETRSVP